MRRTLPVVFMMVLTLATAVLARGRVAEPGGADVIFSGRILNDETSAPIAGALISVRQTGRGTMSSNTGAYRLVVPAEGLPSGDVTLVVSSLGFEQATVTITAPVGVVQRDVRLRPAAISLEDVVAVGYGQQTRDAVAQGIAQTASPPPPPTAIRAEELSGIGRVNASAASAPVVGMGAVAGGVTAGFYPRRDGNTESYALIQENVFRAAASNPLSTFSIDVDRASYSNIRRFLLEGQLPPKDAVRIEEMVNYFSYEYPTSRGEHPFAVTTETAPAPWREGHQLIRVGLASRPVAMENLPPSNFVFLIDVSGSMQTPDKLPLVKQSLRLLVDQLRPRDRVAIAVYAGAAGLVLPSTSGSERGRILHAIESLEAGGSTAGGEGLRLAYRVASENFLRGGNNRVILATDGDFNVGVSSDAEMVRLVEEKRGQGTFLTVLGFGTGNLQDSKMEQMADHGNGNYSYIDSLLEARKVLVTEMGGTLLTVASDVKLQVEFNPSRVAAYRLIGYENRLLAAEDFNNDLKDAGEMGAGHVVTALYEIVPVGVRSDVRVGGTDPLRYQEPAANPSRGTDSDELAFVRVRYKKPGTERSLLLEQPVRRGGGAASTDLNFAAAVAGFGMLLRESEHRGSLTVQQVLSMARRGIGPDEGGHRAEFVRLVEVYRGIAQGPRAGERPQW